MSEVRYLNSGPDLVSKDLAFPDLENRLMDHLEASKFLPDLESLIQTLNVLLRSDQYSSDQLNRLRRLRQRAYDRRRNPKLFASVQSHSPEINQQQNLLPFPLPERPRCPKQMPVPCKQHLLPQNEADASIQPKPSSIEEPQMNAQTLTSEIPIHRPSLKNEQPLWQEAAVQGMASLDGMQLLRVLPKVIALLGTTIAANWLLWLQSVGLYKASGFSNPEIIALGGILMVGGFAAYHSVYRSKLALLCCIYACAYETYFIASGTIADELHTKTEAVTRAKEGLWLEEQVTRAQAEYERQKSRFENPSDREHQNQWFKKTFVDPAWDKYCTSQQEFRQYLAKGSEDIAFDHTGWLKIFYRLGLVFLCMLLVHRIAVYRP